MGCGRPIPPHGMADRSAGRGNDENAEQADSLGTPCLDEMSSDVIHKLASIHLDHASRLALACSCRRLHQLCKALHRHIVLDSTARVAGFLRTTGYMPEELILTRSLAPEDVCAVLSTLVCAQRIRLVLSTSRSIELQKRGLESPFRGTLCVILPADPDVHSFSQALTRGVLGHIQGLDVSISQTHGSSISALLHALASGTLLELRSLRLTRACGLTAFIRPAVIHLAQSLPHAMPNLECLDFLPDSASDDDLVESHYMTPLLSFHELDVFFAELPIGALPRLKRLAVCDMDPEVFVQALSNGAVGDSICELKVWGAMGSLAGFVDCKKLKDLVDFHCVDQATLASFANTARRTFLFSRLERLTLPLKAAASWPVLAEAIAAGAFQSLVWLSLSDSPSGWWEEPVGKDADLDSLLRAIANAANQLRWLAIPLPPRAAASLISLAGALPQLSQLTSLRVDPGPASHSAIDSAAMLEALREFCAALSSLHMLEELELGIWLAQGLSALTKVLGGGALPKLRRLVLNNHVTFETSDDVDVWESLASVISNGKVTQLQSLALVSDRSLALDEPIRRLSMAMHDFGAPKLNTLSLKSNTPGVPLGLLFDGGGFDQLTTLDCSDTDVHDYSIESFSRSLSAGRLPLLRRLKMRNSLLGDSSAIALAEAAVLALRELVDLDLSFNNIGPKGRAAIIMAARRGAWPRLRELYLHTTTAPTSATGDTPWGEFDALPALEKLLV